MGAGRVRGRHADSEAAKALADSAQWLAQGVR
jgi:hypothetical protein